MIERMLRRQSMLANPSSSSSFSSLEMPQLQSNALNLPLEDISSSLHNRRKSWTPMLTVTDDSSPENMGDSNVLHYSQDTSQSPAPIPNIDPQQQFQRFAQPETRTLPPAPHASSSPSPASAARTRPLSLVLPPRNPSPDSHTAAFSPTNTSYPLPHPSSNNSTNTVVLPNSPATTLSQFQIPGTTTSIPIPPIPQTSNSSSSISSNPNLQRAPSAPEAAVSSASRRHYSPAADRLSASQNPNLAHRRIPSNNTNILGRAASTSATSTLSSTAVPLAPPFSNAQQADGEAPPSNVDVNNNKIASISISSTRPENPSSSLNRNSSSANDADPSFVTPWASDRTKPELYGISVRQNRGAWHEHWNISIEKLGDYNEYDVRFQSELHSFIQQEENYVNGLRVFLGVFCDDKLADTIPKFNTRKKFVDTLFEPLRQIMAINNQYLLMPFIKQQMAHKHTTSEQPDADPFLDFLADNVSEWLDKVKAPFIVYAKEFPTADSITSEQLETNENFKSFLSSANTQSHQLCGKDFSSLMHSTRIRFGLYKSHFESLRKSLVKKQKSEDVSSAVLEKDAHTIEGLDACISKCDFLMKQLNEIQHAEGARILMMRYERIFKFKHIEDEIPLNFLHHDQVAEKQAYRKRKGGSWESTLISIILLDHFLFLVRKVSYNEWQVLERPIHMDLLRIESIQDPPIYRSTGDAFVAAVKRQPNHAQVMHSPGPTPRASRPPSLSYHSSQHKPSVSSISSIGSSSTNQTLSVETVLESPVNSATDHHPTTPRTPSTPSFKSSATGSSSSLASSPTSMTVPSPTATMSSGCSANPDAIVLSPPPPPIKPPQQIQTPVQRAMVVDLNPKPNDKLIYPVRLRNLENDNKCRVAFERSQDRDNFVDLLFTTKEKYAMTQYKNHKVPVGLKVLDQASFPFLDPALPLPPAIYTTGDVVDRALVEFNDTPAGAAGVTRRAAVDRPSTVNCALDYTYGKEDVTFIGTTAGIYCARHVYSQNGVAQPLKWISPASLTGVTHIEVCNHVLFVLSNNRLVYLKLNEILVALFSPQDRQTKAIISPAVTVSENVECFHTGKLSDHQYLFYANKSTKALEKTDVYVYEVAERGQRESHKKGFSRLFKGAEAPFAEVLQKPTLIAHELFSPTKVHGFSFFDSYFFFLTNNSFDHLKLNVRNPIPLPRADTMASVLHAAGVSDTAVADFKSQLSSARAISVAFMHWDRSPVNAPLGSKNSANGGPSQPPPPTNTQPNLIHCFHKFAIMSVRNGDLYVPPSGGSTAGSRGALKGFKPFKIPYLHKIEAAYLWYPYVLLFSPQLVEIRLVTAHNFNQSLVQVITGRNIKLLTCDRSSQIPMHSNKGSHAPRIIMSMAHPDPAIHTTVIMELVRNHGVAPFEENLRSSLLDLGEY